MAGDVDLPTLLLESTMFLPRPLSAHIATGTVALVSFLACSKPSDSSVEQPPLPSVDTVANTSSSPGEGACSRSPETGLVEDAFEPESVPNVSLDGVGGTLMVLASTLREGAEGLELYANICNAGDFPLCSAAMQVEFYDAADQLIGSTSTAVQSGRFYRFSQSPYPISCVAPGQTAMAAATNLPEGLVLDDLKSMGHRFPAFQIDDAAPLAGATVSAVDAFETAGGAAFRGTVTNDSDAPISNPTVSVFPVNDVGRPLGVATATATLQIPPGGTWSFETSVIAERGVSHWAFAAASFALTP